MNEPTNEKLLECAAKALGYRHISTSDDYLTAAADELLVFARAALARWGTPAIQPVPVSERLPGPEDCDAEGLCWQWEPDINGRHPLGAWRLQHRDWLSDPDGDATHWLAFDDIPISQCW